MNKQIIRPDDFYDMVEAAESGKVVKTTVNKDIFDGIFLKDFNSLDVQKSLTSNVSYNAYTVEIHISEEGRITVKPIRKLPKYGEFTDIGGMDE